MLIAATAGVDYLDWDWDAAAGVDGTNWYVAAAAGVEGPDWAGLPEEMLQIVMGALEIPDLVRSGAICASWNASYTAFRRLHLPLPTSPKQLPCLLYACHAYAPDAAAVYCPFTGESFRVPLPLRPLTSYATVGSAHGWLVAADEASNLRLFNPVTGAQAELPPITAIHHVESFADADGGGLMYNVFEDLRHDPEPIPFAAREARDCMYHRVALSCSPSAGSACTALLVHMPGGELSYARLGDERWTWISPDDHHCIRVSWGFVDSFYNEEDGLFYVLRHDRSMYTLSLNGPSPVVTKIMREQRRGDDPGSMYLLQAPWGDILQVLRWRSHVESSTPVELPDDLEDDYYNDAIDPYIELKTTDIELYKVDLVNQKLVKMTSLADHALFLGYNCNMCLPTNDFPKLKPNCAYITDDSFEYVNIYKYNWREIGVWDIESKNLQGFECAAPSDPWLNWPSPVWITPSLF